MKRLELSVFIEATILESGSFILNIFCRDPISIFSETFLITKMSEDDFLTVCYYNGVGISGDKCFKCHF